MTDCTAIDVDCFVCVCVSGMQMYVTSVICVSVLMSMTVTDALATCASGVVVLRKERMCGCVCHRHLDPVVCGSSVGRRWNERESEHSTGRE